MKRTATTDKLAKDSADTIMAFEQHLQEMAERLKPSIKKQLDVLHDECIEAGFVRKDAGFEYYIGLIEAFVINEQVFQGWQDDERDPEVVRGFRISLSGLYTTAKIAYDYIVEDKKAFSEEEASGWIPDDLGDQ